MQAYDAARFDPPAPLALVTVKSTAPAINAELQLLGKSFRGQFLLIDGSHGILGRNVLNNLTLLFDGPLRKWTEQP